MRLGGREVRILHLIILLSCFIILVIVLFSLICPPPQKLEHKVSPYFPKEKHGEGIKIVVVIDNYIYRADLATTWGLSIYIETPYCRLLFDTGPNPSILEKNLKALGIDIAKLDFVVISHEHGDHIGGLSYIANVNPGAKVYIPSKAAAMLKEYVKGLGLNPILVENTTEIAPDIYIIGQLYGPPYEEALALASPYGLILVVGCSHPGVENFVKKAMKDLKSNVYIVIGGFHLASRPHEFTRKVIDELIKLGVKIIYPIHCSGDYAREYLHKQYPSRYGDGGVGLVIVINNEQLHAAYAMLTYKPQESR